METTNFRLGKLYNADCLEMLKVLKADSIDCMTTDPPYSINFMQKTWDAQLPSVAIWKECLRIMKPGAFAFVFSAPRQDVLSRMIVNLEDAGFDCSFTSLYHTFSSGFPKASSVSKMIDKRMGAEREVIGKDKHFGRKSESLGIGGQEWDLKPIPSTDKAKEFDSAYAGFQPKPAVEIILCVMKPLAHGSYVDQALDNGKGVTWLGDGRIPAEKEVGWNGAAGFKNTHEASKYGGLGSGEARPETSRFPANLLVSDNVLDAGEVRPSSGGLAFNPNNNVCYGKESRSNTNDKTQIGYGDSGDYSRYFSLDSWFAEHIKDLAPRVRKALPFLIVPKPAKSEKNQGCDELEGKKCNDGRPIDADNAYQRGASVRNNHHPTVKSITIFNYLITIGSRPGDTILDPFLGSGTAALSASMLNRRWVGAEIDSEYCDIIRARIDHLERVETPDLF